MIAAPIHLRDQVNVQVLAVLCAGYLAVAVNNVRVARRQKSGNS